MAKKEIGRPQTAHIAPFGLRMQPALKDRIEAASLASGRSMNAEIVARLSESFAANSAPDAADGVALARSEKLLDAQDRLLSVVAYYLTVIGDGASRNAPSRQLVGLVRALGTAIADRKFEDVVGAAAEIVGHGAEVARLAEVRVDRAVKTGRKSHKMRPPNAVGEES